MEKNKYLGALHTIAFNTQINGMNFGDELRTIKEALIELQELEEENEFLSSTITTVNKKYNSLMSNYQEQKRVLEIVFEKNVDIIMIRMSETLDKYNRMIYKDNFNRKELTQEEFDLLKRYFK